MQIGGGDMLIDDYDVVDEKQDVAIITPDDSIDEPEPEPLADDCTSSSTSCSLHSARCLSNVSLVDAIKAKFLPEFPDLEIEAEAVNTWHIENYRSLSKKEHGPIFQCAGFPWYVDPIHLAVRRGR